MFEYTFNFADVELTAKAEEVGTVEKWNALKMESEITLFADGKQISFSYYAPEEVANENDLASALHCFLLDAIAFENAKDIDDFASEFGYTKISECIAAYNACHESFDDACYLDLDCFALIEELESIYDL